MNNERNKNGQKKNKREMDGWMQKETYRSLLEMKNK